MNDVVQNERERIWGGIERLYANSKRTRTPIYQDTMYDYMKKLVWAAHPPVQFRDTSNGE